MRVSPRTYTKRLLALYMLAIFIGLGGIVISRQIVQPGPRVLFLTLSLAVPLFTVGMLFSRFQGTLRERLVLYAGLLMLVLGAALGASGASSALFDQIGLPNAYSLASRAIGIASVALGLAVVVFLALRRGEDAAELSARFRILAEQIKEGFVLTDPGGAIFLVNRRFLDLAGLAEDRVLGRGIDELQAEIGADLVGAQPGDAARGLSSEYETNVTVRGDERRLAVNATPIFNPGGDFAATLTTVRDITEPWRLAQRVERYAKGLQQLVEEQARQLVRSEERFRQLLLSMNEGFLTLDHQHRIRFVNARLQELLGRGEQALVDHDLFGFVDHDARAGLLNMLSQDDGAAAVRAQREIALVHSSGERVPVLAGLAYIGNEAGEELAYSLVVTSVKDLKSLQGALEARAAELERLNAELRMHDRAKDAFLSNVSHELRTPLSTIQGYIEMLTSGNLGGLDPPKLSALGVMARNAERLSALINEMIEFSRMEIRGVQVRPGLYAPARLVRDAMASVHPLAAKKELELEADCPEHMPYAWCDRQKMLQVLGILLNNAVKFTPAGGRIRIGIQTLPGRTLAIDVTDTGIGIDPAHQERVFEKFYQVDASMTRRYEGTGIGLSIAKSIVTAHGGAIALESRLGAGSTFTVLLPGALFEPESPRPAQPPLAGRRFLMIRHDDSLHEAIGDWFETWGGASCAASNAYVGIREAHASTPDAIVADDSPEDPGAQHILALLRQDAATAAVPVLVVMDGQSGPPDAILHDPATGYIAKPFMPEALLDTLNTLLSGAEELHSRVTSVPPASRLPRVLVVDADLEFLQWAELALAKRHAIALCATSIEAAQRMLAADPPQAVFVDADLWPRAEAPPFAEPEAPAEGAPPLYLMAGWTQPGEAPPRVAGILKKPFPVEAFLSRIPDTVQRGLDIPVVSAVK